MLTVAKWLDRAMAPRFRALLALVASYRERDRDPQSICARQRFKVTREHSSSFGSDGWGADPFLLGGPITHDVIGFSGALDDMTAIGEQVETKRSPPAVAQT